jgi:ribosomal-protein-alanine N-acetyltransferase
MAHFPKPLTRAESDALAARIRAHIDARGFGLWALDVGGTFAGFVGLSVPTFESRFTPCVEVGWRLAHGFWGHGYASEAASAALRYGFDALKLDEIVSFTVPANHRSWAVMERIGMQRDPDGDFDHPALPAAHPLARHLLYRARRCSAASSSPGTGAQRADGVMPSPR